MKRRSFLATVAAVFMAPLVAAMKPEPRDSISIRFIRQWDRLKDTPARMDVLFGWATVRPEYASRLSEA